MYTYAKKEEKRQNGKSGYERKSGTNKRQERYSNLYNQYSPSVAEISSDKKDIPIQRMFFTKTTPTFLRTTINTLEELEDASHFQITLALIQAKVIADYRNLVTEERINEVIRDSMAEYGDWNYVNTQTVVQTIASEFEQKLLLPPFDLIHNNTDYLYVTGIGYDDNEATEIVKQCNEGGHLSDRMTHFPADATAYVHAHTGTLYAYKDDGEHLGIKKVILLKKGRVNNGFHVFR